MVSPFMQCLQKFSKYTHRRRPWSKVRRVNGRVGCTVTFLGKRGFGFGRSIIEAKMRAEEKLLWQLPPWFLEIFRESVKVIFCASSYYMLKAKEDATPQEVQIDLDDSNKNESAIKLAFLTNVAVAIEEFQNQLNQN